MKSAIVYLEHGRGVLPKATLGLISAAKKIGAAAQCTRLIGVLIGSFGTAKAASDAALFGLDEVVYVENKLFEHYLALNYQAVLKLLCDELKPEVFICAADSQGKDLAPRVAHDLAAGQASDIVSVLENGCFIRPMYAGNVLAQVEISTGKKVVTVRTTAFPVAKPSPEPAEIRAVELSLQTHPGQEFVSSSGSSEERPQLSEADIVVSVGRAIRSVENFEKYIVPLADVLGAALGATRAAVDAGYAPNDWQVGQTGKIVAPDLYIAIGLSGAVQHLAGMKGSKRVVAINSDPEAPIFEVADYGLVEDLFSAVPELIQQLQKGEL